MATWTKQQRDRAKAEGLGLISIAVDGRHLPTPFGTMEFAGPADEATTKEVLDYLTQILARRSRKLKESQSSP